jgi:ribonuclease P protein component
LVVQHARLTERRDFVRVQTEGRRFRGNLLAVLVLPAPGTSAISRVGYTVSRKVGNAVVRNRVRRRLREITRFHASCLSPSFDYVVIAFTGAKDATFVQLRDELGDLYGRVAKMVASRSPGAPLGKGDARG